MRLVRILLITAIMGSPCHAGEMEWSIGTINGVDWAHYRNAKAELIIQIAPKSCGEWSILVSSEASPLNRKRTIELRTDSLETIVWKDFDGLRRATVTQTFVENLLLRRILYIKGHSTDEAVKVPLTGFGEAYRALNLDCEPQDCGRELAPGTN